MPLSKTYEYSIWLSYAEVYNEKIYDLLLDSQASSLMLHSLPSNMSFTSMNSSSTGTVGLGIGTSLKHASAAASNIKRKALSLKQDKESGCKYIAGLREVRVFDAEVSHLSLPSIVC